MNKHYGGENYTCLGDEWCKIFCILFLKTEDISLWLAIRLLFLVFYVYQKGNKYWFMISNLYFMKHWRWSAFFINLYNGFWVPIDKSSPKVPAKTLTYSVGDLKEAEVGFDPSSVKPILQNWSSEFNFLFYLVLYKVHVMLPFISLFLSFSFFFFSFFSLKFSFFSVFVGLPDTDFTLGAW